jgi:O-6-methylguanine DNA methyltransferase
MVGPMRAEHTRYEAPGWGVGEVWTTPCGVLLAHEIEFGAAAGPAVARPPMGAASPPTGTLTTIPSRVGTGSAPSVCQSVDAHPRAHGGPAERLGSIAAARFVELASAFLAGEDVSFDDVELDLSWATSFQRAVAERIRALPRGEVAAYGEVAALAGYPGAARAVGTFCAHNRFLLVLPCHRVVGADGIGGYGSAGVGVKRRLLALEGARV